MDRQAFFDDLQHRVLGLLRSGPAADLERNLKALLAQAFQRLELVTREEFELQRELLARTRDKLDALEDQLRHLEARQSPAPRSNPDSASDPSASRPLGAGTQQPQAQGSGPSHPLDPPYHPQH